MQDHPSVPVPNPASTSLPRTGQHQGAKLANSSGAVSHSDPSPLRRERTSAERDDEGRKRGKKTQRIEETREPVISNCSPPGSD